MYFFYFLYLVRVVQSQKALCFENPYKVKTTREVFQKFSSFIKGVEIEKFLFGIGKETKSFVLLNSLYNNSLCILSSLCSEIWGTGSRLRRICFTSQRKDVNGRSVWFTRTGEPFTVSGLWMRESEGSVPKASVWQLQPCMSRVIVLVINFFSTC